MPATVRHCASQLTITGITLVLATSAAAQVLQPPPRSAAQRTARDRGADPRRAAHQFVVSLTAMSGFEDNVFGQDTLAVDPSAPARSAVSHVFAGDAQYRFGDTASYFEADARAYANSVSNVGVRPIIGGDGVLRGATVFGSRVNISADLNTRYQPGLTIGGITTIGEEGAPVDPTTGISELRTTATDALTTVGFTLSRRQQLTAMYGYSVNNVTSFISTDSSSHVATLGHTWDFRRSASVQLQYQRMTYTSEARGATTHPVDTQTGSVMLQMHKRLSLTRQISFSGGVRAARIDTISSIDGSPFDYVSPSGFGGAQLDLGRTWALAADLRRELQTLEGLTQQTFLTDVISVWTGGSIGPAFSVTVSATHTNGHPHEGEGGSYGSSGGMAQLQYDVSRCCAILGTYAYYAHRLRILRSVPSDYPDRFDRNTVRVGMVIQMPLIGPRAPQRPGATGRN